VVRQRLAARAELRHLERLRRRRAPRALTRYTHSGRDLRPGERTIMTEKLLMQKDGALGWIIFNQPEKRNAVSLEMWEAMPDYVRELTEDDAIRVVILRGAGEDAFVSGADISQFKERRRNMADQEEYARISSRGQDS